MDWMDLTIWTSALWCLSEGYINVGSVIKAAASKIFPLSFNIRLVHFQILDKSFAIEKCDGAEKDNNNSTNSLNTKHFKLKWHKSSSDHIWEAEPREYLVFFVDKWLLNHQSIMINVDWMVESFIRRTS